MKKIGQLPKAWWWQLLANLPGSGLTPPAISALERRDKHILSKLREYAFGTVDTCVLQPDLMHKPLMAHLMMQRYGALGSRLAGWYEVAVADGEVHWLRFGAYRLGAPDATGRIRDILHISGAEVARRMPWAMRHHCALGQAA